MSRKWEEAFSLLRYIELLGYEAYIVGGAVRDYLLNKEEKDIDVVMNATVKEIMRLFPKAKQPSAAFPMVLVPWKSLFVEVSPYREGTKTLEEDLACRDFTINALALKENGTIIDPYGGKNDLQHRILRSIDPSKRFQEDPLRILRLFRFAGELSFHIEKKTMTTACQLQHLLSSVAVERIQQELDRLLQAKDHERVFHLMTKHHLFMAFPVELQPERPLPPTLCWNFHMLVTPAERWAAFLWNLYGRNANKKWPHWRFSKKMTRSLSYFFQAIQQQESLSWDDVELYDIGIERVLQIERFHQWVYDNKDDEKLRKVAKVYRQLPIQSRQDLRVNGKDVLTLFPKIERKKVGWILREVEKAVLRKEVKNKEEELVSYVKGKLRYEG